MHGLIAAREGFVHAQAHTRYPELGIGACLDSCLMMSLHAACAAMCYFTASSIIVSGLSIL